MFKETGPGNSAPNLILTRSELSGDTRLTTSTKETVAIDLNSKGLRHCCLEGQAHWEGEGVSKDPSGCTIKYKHKQKKQSRLTSTQKS